MSSPIPKTVGRPAESTAGPTENLIRPVERDAIGNGGGTTGIARNVELYNLAFRILATNRDEPSTAGRCYGTVLDDSFIRK